MHARPHRNGNTPKHFHDASRRLDNALRELRNACTDIVSDVMHGRNYQHLTDINPMAAREADLKDLRLLLQKLEGFDLLVGRIYDASLEGSSR